MTQRLLLLAFQFCGALALMAGVTPIYINRYPVQAPPDIAPQINARAFVNLSTFDVNDASLLGLYALPYQMLNNQYFTNFSEMSGSPGYRFDYFSGNVRRPMSWWVNEGDISTFNTNLFFFTLYFAPANWLLVNSTNIVNPGSLNADAAGLIRLEGRHLNLSFARIRCGNPIQQGFFFGGGYLLSTNYLNEPGITDYYWGAGSNNVMSGSGSLMPLNLPPFSTPNFNLPSPRSPIHEVAYNTGFTSTTVIPFFSTLTRPYVAAAYTNQFGNDRVVQVVFYPSNQFDTNLSSTVHFYQDDADGGATVIFGLHTVEADPVLDVAYTNSLFLLDALAFRTNVSLARNLDVRTRKPTTYEITRDTPFQFASLFSALPNTEYTPDLLWNPSFQSNAVPVTYAAYAANIEPFTFLNAVQAPTHPTNFPGRVEITGRNVNLDHARIRAENTFILKADNLVSNFFAKVSAPYVSLDVGTRGPELVITNVAESSVARFSGSIYAWSAIWRNEEVATTPAGMVTNTTRFHVLMVDHSLQSRQPVTVLRFAARATNGLVVISDEINVQESIQIAADALHVTGRLQFPPRAQWAKTNVSLISYFTNDGTIRVFGGVNAGADRKRPYTAYVNRGTNHAASHYIRTEYFENSGWLLADGGPIEIRATDAFVQGSPSEIFPINQEVYTWNGIDWVTNIITVFFTNSLGAAITAASDVRITSESLTLSNAFIQAGLGSVRGSIYLQISESLQDAGPGALNRLVSSSGIQVLDYPSQVRDLRGTHVLTRLPNYGRAVHVWPAADLGPTPAGFNNNLALGRLTLEGGTNSQFLFFGTGEQNAMYVEYLELLGSAVEIENTVLVNPNFTIYFADANGPVEKIEELSRGRIRFVPGYTPVGTAAVPASYLTSPDLMTEEMRDDDGDGIRNAHDPTPFFTPESVGLQITPTEIRSPGIVQLSWKALPLSVSYLEFKTAVTDSQWQVLQTLTNRELSTSTLTTEDLVVPGQDQRIYRVRVVPPSSR